MQKVQRTARMDRRVQKTKRAITHALADLLQEKKLDDITITELCRVADINRKTFYMHFSSLEDVFQYIVNGIRTGFFEIQQQFNSSAGYELRASISLQLERINADLPYFQALAKGNEYHRLYMEIMQVMEDARLQFTHSTENTVKYVLRFLHGAYLATLTDWLRDPEGRTYQDVSDFYINSALRVREAYQIDDVV